MSRLIFTGSYRKKREENKLGLNWAKMEVDFGVAVGVHSGG